MDSNRQDQDHSSGECLVPDHSAEAFPTDNEGARGKWALSRPGIAGT